MPSRRALSPVAFAAVAAFAFAGCGAGQSPALEDSGPTSSTPTTASSTGCGPVEEEPLDPDSAKHVFPGAAEPAYLTDPPTSGPHQVGDHPTGDLQDPIPRPIQVAMLEHGYVLIQYRDPALRAQLTPLVDEHTTIAPNPGLPAPVVATAWQHKQACQTPEEAALRDFVGEHAGERKGH